MSWQSNKTGRPKEEGGHKRINISLDDMTRRKLEKLKKQRGNISQFIEKEIKPVLEQLDPGEKSIHIYRIEAYLSNQIIDAHNKGDFEGLRVLGSLAKQIDDYRKLAHIQPIILPFPSTEEKKQFPHFGFFAWLEKRAERKRQEKDIILRRLEMEYHILLEKMHLKESDPELLKKIEQIEDKWHEKYGLVA